MRPILFACLSLLIVSCTMEARHSRTCYETKPYDYANLPTIEKGQEAPYVPTYGNCPAPVAAALMNDMRCNAWLAERASNPRVADNMMRGLQCASMADQLARLKQQYQHDPAVMRALDNSGIL